MLTRRVAGTQFRADLKAATAYADKENMRERRSEVRMLCADMVEIRWKDGDGKARRSSALLEDISPSGACLQLDRPVPLGTEVRWHSPKQEFVGSVRYCVYREVGYFLGVSFEPGLRWSQENYKPQHLLDLKALIEQRKQ